MLLHLQVNHYKPKDIFYLLLWVSFPLVKVDNNLGKCFTVLRSKEWASRPIQFLIFFNQECFRLLIPYRPSISPSIISLRSSYQLPCIIWSKYAVFLCLIACNGSLPHWPHLSPSSLVTHAVHEFVKSSINVHFQYFNSVPCRILRLRRIHKKGLIRLQMYLVYSILVLISTSGSQLLPTQVHKSLMVSTVAVEFLRR